MEPLTTALLTAIPAHCFNESGLIDPDLSKEIPNTLNMIYIIRQWAEYTRQLENDVEELQAIVDSYQGDQGI